MDDVEMKNVHEEFAKELTKAVIYDPASTAAKTSRTFTGTYSLETIYGYLKNPTSNEKNLRDASIYMYHINTRYHRLLQYYAGLPTYSYVVTPLNFNPQKVNKDTFKKQYQKVLSKLELMNLRDEIRLQVLVALREGVFFGVRWGDSSSSFVQKLNPDMCQITSISDGVFLFSVDMSKIKEETIDCYPPEFRTMFDAYNAGGNKWQSVDPEISVCVKADRSVLEYSIPPFVGALPELYEINDTQSLQEASDELDNYKIVAGTMPLDDNGVPKMSFQDMMQYYNQIAGNIGDRVGLAISPFELKAIDFSKSASADAIDAIARAVNNFWSSCGTSAILHGAENKTAGGLKLSIKQDETFIFGILDQCERQMNRYLKTAMGGTNKFKISFLRTTVFNIDDMLSKYKESINYGIGKLYYMSALNIPQYDIEGSAFIENELLAIDELLKPLKTSSTLSSDQQAEAGRPAEDETDLSESGESTRDNDENENR